MSEVVSPDRLRVFIERLEHLEKEKAEIAQHMRETLNEAKNEGFDVKIMRTVLRLRKLKPQVREEIETMVDLYLSAIESQGAAARAAAAAA